MGYATVDLKPNVCGYLVKKINEAIGARTHDHPLGLISGALFDDLEHSAWDNARGCTLRVKINETPTRAVGAFEDARAVDRDVAWAIRGAVAEAVQEIENNIIPKPGAREAVFKRNPELRHFGHALIELDSVLDQSIIDKLAELNG